MIDKRSSEFEVLLRSQIAEFPEVVNQVRLVEVTGRKTDVRPIHIRLALHGLDHLAEPLKPMELFRLQANFISE